MVADNHLFLSAVTLAGIELMRNQNFKRAKELEVWLDLVTDTYNVLPMDGVVFHRHHSQRQTYDK